MLQWPRWFVWRLGNWDGSKYKDKHPWAHKPMVQDGRTVSVHSRFDARNACLSGDLMSYQDAAIWLEMCRTEDAEHHYSLGWYVMPDAGYWFLDLDGCVSWPQGYQGAPAVSGLAQEAMRILPGCFVEYSSSLHGLHILGRGVLPRHKTKGRGMPDGVELYSKDRGICFGMTGYAWGNADTPAMPPWIVEDNDIAIALPGGRMPEWHGPEDDDALIAKLSAGKRGDAAALLTGKPTLTQLWAGGPEVVAKYAGASEADGALATHLAWWTGCDVERMIRLMWRSGLVREKWDADGHHGYVRLTCETAARRHLAEGRGCFDDRPRVQPLLAVPALPVIDAAAVMSAAPVAVPLEVVEEVQRRGVPGATLALSGAGNTDELKEAAKRVAGMQEWDAADLETLSQRLRRKSKELIGEGWSIALCRNMLLGIEEESMQFAAPDWLDDWVFISSTNKYCNVAANFTMLSKEALHVALYNKPEVPLKGNGDKEDVPKMFNMWGVRVAHALGYNPRAGLLYEKHGQTLLNQFYCSMPEVSAAPLDLSAVEVFRMHVWHVAGHDQRQYEFLLKWMAHIVQKPGKLIRWAVMVIGLPGTGKTMLSKPLEAALGSRNVKLAGAKGVNNTGGFMDWVASAQLLGVINDFSITGRDKYETAEAIKPVITDDQVSITRKGVTDAVYDNYAAYMVSTNVREPMPMSINERRWFVLFTEWLNRMVTERPDEAEEYFSRLDAAIKSMDGGQWRAWFESIPCDDLPNRAPRTSEVVAMVANNRSESQQALEELVAGQDVVTTNRISEALRGVEGGLSGRGIARAMNDLGFDYYEKRMKFGAAAVGIYTRRAAINAAVAPWEIIRMKAIKFNEDMDAQRFAAAGVTAAPGMYGHG